MKEKSLKINILKIIIMFLVVIGHSTRIFTINGAIPGINNNIVLSLITELIYGFHMPTFFLISGFIYGICIENGKYNNFIQFLKNKFNRLIIPYLFFGLLYVAPIMIALKLTSYNYFQFSLNNILLLKDSRHLWFLPILFIIFLICNLINKSRYRKILILFLIFSSIIYQLLGLTIPIVSNVCKYIIFFYLGIFFNKYCIKLHTKYNLIIGFIFLTIYVLNIIYNLNFIVAFNPLLAIIGIFLILFSFKSKDLDKNNKIINVLGKYNMGIYLFHPMIIYIFFSISYIKNINEYISCFLSIVISYLISLLLTKLLFLCHLDFLIGEK